MMAAMKNVSEELRYDGASLQQVHAMLLDPSFREAVCDEQRVLRREVTVADAGSGTVVDITQVQSAGGLPSFVRRFVGEEITITQHEEWHRPERGEVEMTIPGQPGEISGATSLTEDARGVTQTVDLGVRIGVPLVGGKIEGLVAEMILKAYRVENRVGREWLARQG